MPSLPIPHQSLFLLRPCLVSKKIQDSSSHRIFGHMYGALNVVYKNNQMHNLAVNDEMNLLSLISLWLDTNDQIKTKVLQKHHRAAYRLLLLARKLMPAGPVYNTSHAYTIHHQYLQRRRYNPRTQCTHRCSGSQDTMIRTWHYCHQNTYCCVTFLLRGRNNSSYSE